MNKIKCCSCCMIKFRMLPSFGDDGGGVFVFLNDELRGEILGEGVDAGA